MSAMGGAADDEVLDMHNFLEYCGRGVFGFLAKR